MLVSFWDGLFSGAMLVSGRVSAMNAGSENWGAAVDTADERNPANPANQLRLVVFPFIYKVLYIPGGAGFLPSKVWRIVCFLRGSIIYTLDIQKHGEDRCLNPQTSPERKAFRCSFHTSSSGVCRIPNWMSRDIY